MGEISALLLPYAITAGLVLARVAALVGTAPVFSSLSVSNNIKIGLVATITAAVMGAGPYHLSAVPLEPFHIAGAVILELAVGAVMGFSVSVVFAALDFAGQIIGIQMGFAIANVIDPTTMRQVGVLSQVLRLVALMLFLVVDGHLLLLHALFESFRQVPLGGASLAPGPVVAEMIQVSADLFSSGFRIALPVCCVVLLVNVGLSTLARAVPQVSIFSIGFLLSIGVGLTVLGLALPAMATTFSELILEAVKTAFRMARLV